MNSGETGVWARTLRTSGILVGFLLLLGTGVSHLSQPTQVERFLGAYGSADMKGREAVVEEYKKYLTFPVMLNVLEQRYSFCHNEGHPIGRVIFRSSRSLSDALATCNSSCGNGCSHGALMELFSSETDEVAGVLDSATSSDAVLSDVRLRAQALCSSPDITKYILPSQCIHGIGHVMTFAADYDIQKAVNACEVFDSTAKKAFCSSGAFMEYLSPGSPRSTEVPDDYYPCDLFPEDRFPQYADGCYRYKEVEVVRRLGRVAAVETCAKLTGSTHLSCIYGVGHAAGTLEMLQKPHGLDTVCDFSDAAEREACMSGAVSLISFNIANSLDVQCADLAPEYRATCFAMLEKVQSVQ